MKSILLKPERRLAKDRVVISSRHFTKGFVVSGYKMNPRRSARFPDPVSVIVCMSCVECHPRSMSNMGTRLELFRTTK